MRFINTKEELEKLLEGNHYFSREWRCYKKLIKSNSINYRKRLLKALVKRLSKKNVILNPTVIMELLQPKEQYGA